MTNPQLNHAGAPAQRFLPNFARAETRSKELREQWEKELGEYLESAKKADLIAESDLSIRVNTVAE